MLIIPREKSEGIVIGDNIIVTVADICDDSVQLDIEIPKEMTCDKGEELDAIRQSSEEI